MSTAASSWPSAITTCAVALRIEVAKSPASARRLIGPLGAPVSSNVPSPAVRVLAPYHSGPFAFTITFPRAFSASPLTVPRMVAPSPSERTSVTSWLVSPVSTASAGALDWLRSVARSV